MAQEKVEFARSNAKGVRDSTKGDSSVKLDRRLIEIKEPH